MTLQQLASVRQWHLAHPLGHQVEQQVWDGMLSAWVFGWTGVPVSWFLDSFTMVLGCTLLVTLPGLYVQVRRHLHRRGTLRCDWLASLRAPER